MPVSSTLSTSAPKSASSSEQKPPGSSRDEVEDADALERHGVSAAPPPRQRPSRSRAPRRPSPRAARRPRRIRARLGDEVAVGARHLAVGQVEVVLQARRARCRRASSAAPTSIHCVAPDPDDAPVGSPAGHVARPCGRGCGRSAGCRRSRPSRTRRAAAARSRPMSSSGSRLATWPESKHSCSGLMPSSFIAVEQLDDRRRTSSRTRP